MSAGRTSWFPRDAAKHRRELIVELGEEFGPMALAVLDVIDAWAQEQRDGGVLKGGFRTLARESFVTVSHAESPAVAVRTLVERATAIGVLDDLQVDPDGRRFTCRVSGWEADSTRGRAALRQADKRNRDTELPVTPGDAVTSEGDVSREVTVGALEVEEQRREEKEHQAASPPRSRAHEAGSSSGAESVECATCSAPAGEKCNATRGGKRDSYHLARHHAVGELTHIKAGGKTDKARLSNTGGQYAPSAEAARLQSAHFPDADVGAIDSALFTFKSRGWAVSPEAIRAHLWPDETRAA